MDLQSKIPASLCFLSFPGVSLGIQSFCPLSTNAIEEGIRAARWITPTDGTAVSSMKAAGLSATIDGKVCTATLKYSRPAPEEGPLPLSGEAESLPLALAVTLKCAVHPEWFACINTCTPCTGWVGGTILPATEGQWQQPGKCWGISGPAQSARVNRLKAKGYCRPGSAPPPFSPL